MSLIIQIPDLDDSTSLLDPLVEYIAGFPAAKLKGLYLFEDGDIGSAPTRVTDSSGNMAHATVLSGASITRSVQGVTTGNLPGLGFYARTPFEYEASFSFVTVLRNRTASPGGSFPIAHLTSASGSAGTDAMNQNWGEATQVSNGSLMLNFDSNSSTACEIGLLNRHAGSGNSNNPWDGASGIRPFRATDGAKTQWLAAALSIDAATGIVTLRALGQTLTFTSLSGVTAFLANGGKHMFGFGAYNAPLSMGDVGLAAFYDGAQDAAGLDVLIAAAKARMALRGVTPR